VLVDGQSLVFGGTSAVAPLWAGLVAVLNQKLGRRLGYVNPILYTMNQSAGFRDIITGNNGAFNAQPGWDAATGLGSPMAGKLLQALGGPAPHLQQQTQPQSQEHTRIDV
jgi:kumamolisin